MGDKTQSGGGTDKSGGGVDNNPNTTILLG